MYAVIETGGKQYQVNEGDIIFIEKLAAEADHNPFKNSLNTKSIIIILLSHLDFKNIIIIYWVTFNDIFEAKSRHPRFPENVGFSML